MAAARPVVEGQPINPHAGAWGAPAPVVEIRVGDDDRREPVSRTAARLAGRGPLAPQKTANQILAVVGGTWGTNTQRRVKKKEATP